MTCDEEGAMAEELINPKPRTAQVAARGIQDTQDFMNLMEATIQDLAEERITPQRGNAITNAGGKMLKAAEMRERWGQRRAAGSLKAFPLATENNGDTAGG
jgi:hypothetical protein